MRDVKRDTKKTQKRHTKNDEISLLSRRWEKEKKIELLGWVVRCPMSPSSSVDHNVASSQAPSPQHMWRHRHLARGGPTPAALRPEHGPRAKKTPIFSVWPPGHTWPAWPACGPNAARGPQNPILSILTVLRDFFFQDRHVGSG